MKKYLLLTGLAIAVIPPAPSFAAPRAEQVLHHGYEVASEGSVRDCLGCHDGKIAKRVTLSTMIGNYFGTHPVYRDYPPHEKADDYIPEEQLIGAGIRLVNGQITCISCHNLKNQERFHLAVPLDNSDLCFRCHKI